MSAMEHGQMYKHLVCNYGYASLLCIHDVETQQLPQWICIRTFWKVSLRFILLHLGFNLLKTAAKLHPTLVLVGTAKWSRTQTTNVELLQPTVHTCHCTRNYVISCFMLAAPPPMHPD